MDTHTHLKLEDSSFCTRSSARTLSCSSICVAQASERMFLKSFFPIEFWYQNLIRRTDEIVGWRGEWWHVGRTVGKRQIGLVLNKQICLRLIKQRGYFILLVLKEELLLLQEKFVVAVLLDIGRSLNCISHQTTLFYGGKFIPRK